jgi:hypothetical protein
VCPNFEVLFFAPQKSGKHYFLQKTSSIAKRVINFVEGEMYLLAKTCFPETPFLKIGHILN